MQMLLNTAVFTNINYHEVREKLFNNREVIHVKNTVKSLNVVFKHLNFEKNFCLKFSQWLISCQCQTKGMCLKTFKKKSDSYSNVKIK